jgi:regulatory protein
MGNRNIKSYVFKLLSKRDYFSSELKNILLKKGFSEEEINHIIEYLKRNGYIDDEKLKERFIEKYLEKGKSFVYIKNKLYQKGITDEIKISFEDELNAALNLLRFKYRKSKDFKEVVKFLSYRGFSYDVISEAYRIFTEEEE